MSIENQITAVIVDDEKNARDVLNILLERNCPNVKVISECSNIPDAVKVIKKHKPNLVFLDIQMPGFSGIEITKFIDYINFEIVFVTAFNEFALKAFELSAIDYLLKPVNRERLKQAVNRVETKVSQKNILLNYQALKNNLTKEKEKQIIIGESSGKRVVKISDIIAIEGQRAYSNLYLKSGEEILASKNLKYFENMFSEEKNIFRCHKSWIVNKYEIEKISKKRACLVLTNRLEVKISKEKISELENLMIN